jgi:uncharacterized membrane protein YbhN (UPF0104 family)
MNILNRRPRVALLLSVLIAGGTVAAIAASDRPAALWHALEHIRPLWLLGALAAELLAYVGYIVAYRAMIVSPEDQPLSLLLTIRLVVAGFGPFAAMGGFAFDRRALVGVHQSARRARAQVLGLGVVEYLLLAPAAFVCAVILLAQSKASLALTLPWVISVPPGFLLGWRATQARVLAYFQRSDGRLRKAIGELLSGVQVLRVLVLHPLERRWALVGMALYWAAEIACLGLALRCFAVEIPVPALIVAYATGYAASRRSLPLGGAGITEALLTVSLIAVHVNAVQALLAVLAYRLVNFLAPVLPGLLAHSSLEPLLEDAGG